MDTTSGSTSGTPKVATQEDIKELWLLFLDHQLSYMRKVSQGKAKMSVKRMQIIRDFLRDNNIGIDAAHVADVATSLETLKGLVLPFQGDDPKL